MSISRRAFVQSVAMSVSGTRTARAQPKPSVTLVITGRCRAASAAAMPSFARLRGDSAYFARSYTVCPDAQRCVSAIMTSRYPHHLAGASDPTLASLLQAAGIHCDMVDLTRTPRQQSYQAGLDMLDSTLEGFLREHGADTNRILVVTATRGAILGEHHATSDDTWFEEAVRIPLLVRWPAMIRRSESDMLVNSLNIMPTILGLCGLAAPPDLQGQDVSPFLKRLPGEHAEWVYGEGGFGTPWEWRMFVRGLDKAIFDVNGALEHLYNLGDDPSESRDLAGSPEQERKTDELSALVDDLRRRTQDHMDPSGLRRR